LEGAGVRASGCMAARLLVWENVPFVYRNTLRTSLAFLVLVLQFFAPPYLLLLSIDQWFQDRSILTQGIPAHFPAKAIQSAPEDMKKKQPKMRQDAVAIIGMAMELPKGVNDTSKLWEFIARARHATGPIPKERFDATGFYHPNRSKAGHFNVRGGSFLDEVAAFDAPFFNISEEEAKTMDPQHRLLLECAFRALENAGIALDTITGSEKFGVFVGGSKSDYDDRMSMDPYTTSQYSAIGPATTMFSNRISYFFNLRGPSVTVDTACSSSLTALHYAVESIRNGDCESAIVGGSFLQLSPLMLTYMSTLG